MLFYFFAAADEKAFCHACCAFPFLQYIAQLVEDDTLGGAARGRPFMSRVQQCFAVRSTAGSDGLLEMARGSLSRLTESIQELGNGYVEDLDLPGLKVRIK